MKRNALAIWGRSSEPPYMGSVAFVNAAVERAMKDLNYEVHAVGILGHQHRNQSKLEEWIPLHSASVTARVNALLNGMQPEVCVYDDTGLSAHHPEKKSGTRNFLVMHGMCFNFQSWIANSAIEKIVCFSRYWADTVRAVQVSAALAESLDEDFLPATSEIVEVPMPFHDPGRTGGYEGAGTELPVLARQALAGGGIVGHALSSGKVNPYAVVSIVSELVARQPIGRNHVWMLVTHSDMPRYARAVTDLGLSESILERMIPVRYLKNPEMIKIMESADFCLCYNEVPESFGLYAVESIFHGCPVFTNGVGNLRYLFPRHHGLHLIESSEHYSRQENAFARTAEHILETVAERNTTEMHCAAGRRYIETEYSYEKFLEHFHRSVISGRSGGERLREKPVLDFSPCVRSWDPATRLLVSDYKTVQLTPDESILLEEIIGKSLDSIRGLSTWETELRMFLQSTLRSGITTFRPTGATHDTV